MKKSKGFTLIELLAVIVILGILLAISVVAVNNIRKKQEKENVQNIISSILTGAKKYVSEHPEVIFNLNVNTATEESEQLVKISIEELLDKNYVDFDRDKYKDLIYYADYGEGECAEGSDKQKDCIRNVRIRSCSYTHRTGNENKLVYIYWYYEDNPNHDQTKNAKVVKYTDCGCEEQGNGGTVSNELCTE